MPGERTHTIPSWSCFLTLFGLDSESQYSRHLTRNWQALKNVKSEDKEIMAQVQQQRKQDEGKETEFEVWNQPVASHKIERYMNNRRNTTSANVPTCKPICLSHATVIFLGREQEKQKTNHNL